MCRERSQWFYLIPFILIIAAIVAVHSCARHEEETARAEAELTVIDHDARVRIVDRWLVQKVEEGWRRGSR